MLLIPSSIVYGGIIMFTPIRFTKAKHLTRISSWGTTSATPLSVFVVDFRVSLELVERFSEVV